MDCPQRLILGLCATPKGGAVYGEPSHPATAYIHQDCPLDPNDPHHGVREANRPSMAPWGPSGLRPHSRRFAGMTTDHTPGRQKPLTRIRIALHEDFPTVAGPPGDRGPPSGPPRRRAGGPDGA